ncbi:hypothetical protein GE21DRAFT_3835 [Neurospora crassa]|uniref:Uncharacterized protein n=1 Tax=Neurospora crassa (strain ATCC 24698 / 74-OR23-1A / CBS 708.71 / DSM 1257 / FGSC 987) TaxID=367110 RepID=Q7S339_NEUCR|nr:hypothetical protein NCU09176 [Neurospora crassa OR74A]EAA29850.2 hypothetical protein NCU09176 [Neurospora crassa OR74A]KHE84345.1 hypothetical protein GE21DRAFT_3835 [Neurospora crassa]|eukprot:XP_959086.2 hypothetical protein NCU09176 [Neurospora crassa OR74A]
MSAQQPTERPQPPKSEGYRHGGTATPSSNLKPTITMSMSPHYTLPTSKAGTPLNSAPGTPVSGTLPSLSSLSSLSVSGGYPVPPRGPIRMLSEHAVSDTPLTSDPYGGASSASASGGDYMSYRRPTNAQSQLPTAELRSNLAATATATSATAAMGASGAGAWGSSRGIIGGSGPANPREARETQYVSLSGSRNNSSTALNGMVSSRGHPLAKGENMQQQGEVKTEGEQMAPYGEGEVARAVEGQARKRNTNTNTKRRESMAQGEEQGKRPNLSLAQLGEGGEGEGEGEKEGEKEGEAGSDHHGRERMGSASQREASGERHGRVRGEVSLEPSEADLERKKMQQSWKREEIKQARKAGKDVDGTSGLSGRQPRPEV